MPGSDDVVAVDPCGEERPVLNVAMIKKAVAKIKAANSYDYECWIDDMGTTEQNHPAHQALLVMRDEGHWRAKEILKLRNHKLDKFIRRVLKGKNRTPFLDEVRVRTFKMKLKGEI